MGKKLQFKIFSEKVDPASVKLAVDLLQKPEVEITSSVAQRVRLHPNEIVLLGIRTLEDKHLNEIIDYRKSNNLRVIIFTDSDDPVVVSSLTRLGFTDIFVLPSELQKLKAEISSVVDNITFEDVEKEDSFDKIIGESPEIIEIKALAKKVAKNPNVNLLILGETGTGKGLLARAIHDISPNSSMPFVDIVCSAIPSTLLEAELFGYEAGAFTDAKTRKVGLFELAEEGTIFLDEVGDISLELQVKLLKAIDNRQMRRLGGTEDIPVKARIISATNKNLENLIKQKLFRIDLYHRLNPITLTIPPLRERKNDALLIAKNFVNEFAEKFNKNIEEIELSAKEFLKTYHFPGNIRELRNAVERAVLLSEDSKLKTDDMFPSSKKSSEAFWEENKIITLNVNYEDTSLNDLTTDYVMEVYKKFNKHKLKTASALGISRPKLDRLIADESKES